MLSLVKNAALAVISNNDSDHSCSSSMNRDVLTEAVVGRSPILVFCTSIKHRASDVAAELV